MVVYVLLRNITQRKVLGGPKQHPKNLSGIYLECPVEPILAVYFSEHTCVFFPLKAWISCSHHKQE